MVGKEYNDKVVEGLFAATPPLQGLRLLLSWAATMEGRGAGSSAVAPTKSQRKAIMIADISRAFFEAPARRDVCAELPEEALAGGETTADTVGKLEASLYGTRDASANWQEEVNECMRAWGFPAGKCNPGTYIHKSKKIRCSAHGDDIACAGSAAELRWLKKKLRARFEIKVPTVGADAAAGEVKEARILNRIIRVTEDGWEYEADQRHAGLIVQETGAEKASTLTHPGCGEKKRLEEDASDELVGAEATRFRAVAAIATYLAGDRPDIQFALKELCRKMAKPASGAG